MFRGFAAGKFKLDNTLYVHDMRNRMGQARWYALIDAREAIAVSWHS